MRRDIDRSLSFNLVEVNENRSVKVEKIFNEYTLFYPCDENDICTNYFSVFPPGVYKIELFGASAGYKKISSARNKVPTSCILDDSEVKKYGGNTNCSDMGSLGGAGGYTSAILELFQATLVYIAIGGQGAYSYSDVPNGDQSFLDENRPKGGYNGGGKGASFYYSNPDGAGSAGGGGATDLRIQRNDLFHRVIVSGGGGGSDNYHSTYYAGKGDDGSGGAGGGETAQGYWLNGNYVNLEATQTFGFSFGYGESAQKNGSKHPNGSTQTSEGTDLAGAGGGWYGGFTSHHPSAGAGGGSSFVRTKDAVVPNGDFQIFNDMYEPIESGKYAFITNYDFELKSPVPVQGIWAGNGKAKITVLKCYYVTSLCRAPLKGSFLFCCLFVVLSI